MKSRIKLLLFLTLSLTVLAPWSRAQDNAVYLDKNASLEDRVNDLMGRLTQDEKNSLLGGASRSETIAIPRLQIPEMRMADAGAGVRGIDKSNNGPATAFPSGVAMASTWDPDLIGRAAAVIGVEAHNKKEGSQILLGPAVNIQRSPLGGRNGEYFSEDPFLAARMGVGYILGMQGTGTSACIKHFVCNNEEADRHKVDVEVSERALREIYLPAFEAGVEEGHVWALMSAYNRVNGPYSSANRYLLTDVLKKGWGFDGMVMSDWHGAHQTANVINAGNDLEMPGPGRNLNTAAINRALQNGQTTTAAIDDNVRRILRTIIRTGLLDGPKRLDPAQVNSKAHQKLTREVAEQAIILLKNQGNLLPVDTAKIHSIAVIGLAAQKPQLEVGGSPRVTPFYSVSPLEGIIKRAGDQLTIHFASGDPESYSFIPSSNLIPAGDEAAHGLSGEYFNNANLEGKPVQTRVDRQVNFDWSGQPDVGIAGVGPENFSVRWRGKLVAPATGHYQLVVSADDGCRLYLDGKKVIDHWVSGRAKPLTFDVDLVAGQPHDICMEYFQLTGDAIADLQWRVPGMDYMKDAVDTAKNCDMAVVVVSTFNTEGEEHDRPSMSLPDGQDALVQAIAAVNKKTVVVLNNGNPVDMRPWIDQVPGLLEMWFPGQEGGSALASILFGDVNPSGKLPTTFGARREDYPDFGNCPGVKDRVAYEEGIYVGYRHFDKENIAPLFPFGFGLSYTTFEYGPLRLSQSTLDPQGNVTVSLDVKNSGSRAGREVVELYIHDPSPKIDKPVRELKGFAKVDLAPGETKTVTIPVTPRDLAYFDVPGKQWKADAGDYEIQVGASSRDIRQKAIVHLASDFTEAVPLSVDQLALNGGFGKNAAVDLAAGKPAQASSTAKGSAAGNAVDTDDTTDWISQPGDSQWLTVDLGKSTAIDRVRLFWGTDYALGYAVQVSQDGQAWTDVSKTSKGMGDIEWVRFPSTQARWVRVLTNQPGDKKGVYSLNSFEVYGNSGPFAVAP